MLTLFDYVIFGIGAFLLLIWMFFFLKGLRYRDAFDSLDENAYPFKEIYFVGLAVVQTFGLKFKSKYDRKLRRELEILYGNKYLDFYMNVVYAQKISLSMTLLAMAVPMYGFANDLMATGVMLLFAWAAYYYFHTLPGEKIKKRSEEMLSDFSNVVSKLALLTNAGMTMHDAWKEVAFSGNTEIYREMQLAVEDMKNGISETEALSRFGSRCVIPEIKKFTSTITQGLAMSNRDLVATLQNQSSEVWFLKKQLVRRQGEKASSKLLLPMMLMFVGILIMVIVPVFANLGT